MRKYKHDVPVSLYKYYMDTGSANDKRNPHAIYRKDMADGVADVLGGDKIWHVSGNATYRIRQDSYIDEVTANDVAMWMRKTWKMSDTKIKNLLVKAAP